MTPAPHDDPALCHACGQRHPLSHLLRQQLERIVQHHGSPLTEADRAVIDSLATGTPVSRQPDDDAPSSFGERAADAVAGFGGSWTFICLFLAVMAGWVTLNAGGVLSAPFDPYPFILLNLLLSCIAAIQAPVIMMSQRRQETKDRARALNDYQVNLKAELEIRQLQDRIDRQFDLQLQRMAEMCETRFDRIEERFRDRQG